MDSPKDISVSNLSCPVPISEYRQVLLAHGGGGKLTQQMIQKMFLSQFRNPYLEPLHDGAVFTVNGTVNDLAMCGARPLYLSAAFVIEEGFLMEDLWRVVVSMQEAAKSAGVMLVTGDTKVVDRGKGDKVFINTSGVGIVDEGVDVRPDRAQIGDSIILSGGIAEHGIAIMSVREGLEFETPIRSDTAPLNSLVEAMLAASKDIHVLRDPTRGGVASTLNEIASSSHVGIRIVEERIPLAEAVQGACEILGFDPLYVANEGKLVAFVPPDKAGGVLAAMRTHPLGRDAVQIGEVVADHPDTVIMKSRIGGNRVVDMISGEQLPRIC